MFVSCDMVTVHVQAFTHFIVGHRIDIKLSRYRKGCSMQMQTPADTCVEAASHSQSFKLAAVQLTFGRGGQRIALIYSICSASFRPCSMTRQRQAIIILLVPFRCTNEPTQLLDSLHKCVCVSWLHTGLLPSLVNPKYGIAL